MHRSGFAGVETTSPLLDTGMEYYRQHLNLVTCTIKEARERILDDSKSLIETDNFRKWYRDMASETAQDIQSSDERTLIHEGLKKDKTELNALPRQVVVVAESYRKKQVLFCPVQRMPAEILLEIFHHLRPVLRAKETDPWKSLDPPRGRRLFG
jgi:hypothetical protein